MRKTYIVEITLDNDPYSSGAQNKLPPNDILENDIMNTLSPFMNVVCTEVVKVKVRKNWWQRLFK